MPPTESIGCWGFLGLRDYQRMWQECPCRSPYEVGSSEETEKPAHPHYCRLRFLTGCCFATYDFREKLLFLLPLLYQLSPLFLRTKHSAEFGHVGTPLPRYPCSWGGRIIFHHVWPQADKLYVFVTPYLCACIHFEHKEMIDTVVQPHRRSVPYQAREG